jgi:hypothetical protein
MAGVEQGTDVRVRFVRVRFQDEDGPVANALPCHVLLGARLQPRPVL